jgi:hypothetical protein
VTYLPQDNRKIVRPTTFVHVGVMIERGSKIQETELDELGFTTTDNILPYTLH